MATYASTCFSWRHNAVTPALPGRVVCLEHVDEEPGILEELSELETVSNDIALYEQEKARLRERGVREHPDMAKMLERTLATYLNRRLDPEALAVEGYRARQQLDIVIPRGLSDECFSATARVMYSATGERTAAHLELAYRSSHSTTLTKFEEMLDAIDCSIEEAIAAGTQPPFTGVVLLGNGWAEVRSELLGCLRERYARTARRIIFSTTAFWNFPDVVAWPGNIFKKHDLFVEPNRTAQRVPCFLRFLSGGEALRPLAIMRGYLTHRIRVLRDPAMTESEPWTRAESGAIAGRVPVSASASDLAPLILGQAPQTLWHMRFLDPEDAGGDLFVRFGS